MKRSEQRARTKKKIEEAFLSILKSKHIEKITIKEIADVADIDRKTFYLYFNTVYDVLYAIELDMIEQLKDSLSKKDILDVNKLFDYIEEHVLENEDLLSDLTQRPNFSSMAFHFNEIFSQEISKFFQQETSTNEDKIRITFYTTGIFGVYQSWLTSDKRTPITEYSRFLKKTIGDMMNQTVSVS